MSLLVLSKRLYETAFDLQQRALYCELKYYIENKLSYCKEIFGDINRRIGKTTILCRLAAEYKCPIIVPYATAQRISDLCKAANIDYSNIAEVINHSALSRYRGKPQYDLVLFDEGFDKEFINRVIRPMGKTAVGYYNESMKGITFEDCN